MKDKPLRDELELLPNSKYFWPIALISTFSMLAVAYFGIWYVAGV